MAINLWGPIDGTDDDEFYKSLPQKCAACNKHRAWMEISAKKKVPKVYEMSTGFSSSRMDLCRSCARRLARLILKELDATETEGGDE